MNKALVEAKVQQLRHDLDVMRADCLRLEGAITVLESMVELWDVEPAVEVEETVAAV